MKGTPMIRSPSHETDGLRRLGPLLAAALAAALTAASPAALAGTAEGVALVPKSKPAASSNPGCVFSVHMNAIAQCVTVCATGIPNNATLTNIVGYARAPGSGDWDVCPIGKHCGPGQRAWWLERPITYARNGQKEVCWDFKSWNHTGPLEARIQVTYE